MVSFLHDENISIDTQPNIVLLREITLVLEQLSCSTNFILYILFSRPFRRRALQVTGYGRSKVRGYHTMVDSRHFRCLLSRVPRFFKLFYCLLSSCVSKYTGLVYKHCLLSTVLYVYGGLVKTVLTVCSGTHSTATVYGLGYSEQVDLYTWAG